jgi:tetratricopeptide (TPR) repeat protein
MLRENRRRTDVGSQLDIRWGFVLAASSLVAWGCGWDPSRPFDRNSPAVTQALDELDGGDAGSAASRLEEYLGTGACKDGVIGTPDRLKQRANGTFDLGLALFRVAERYGRRFGEEEVDAGVDEGTRARRHSELECASRIVVVISEDPDSSPRDRAHSRYLQGNLAFLDGDYSEAVRSYDRALVLTPGESDAGDSVGRDAAWNRAIALRRIDEKKDAGNDSGPPDAGGDASNSRPDAGSPDASNDSGHSPDKDSGGSGDSGPESGPQPTPPDAGPDPREAGAPPPPSTDQDDRMLDQLENAPTLQQEEAKRTAKKHVRGMADK